MSSHINTSVSLTIPGMTTKEELEFLYEIAIQVSLHAQLVELGTYLGRTLSILAFAARLRESQLLSIDNYSYDEKCSLDKVRNNLIGAGFEKELSSQKIILLDGDSRSKPNFIREIDFLFIDSHHFKSHFDAEMQTWLDSVKQGGFIVCHDYTSPTWLEMTAAIDGWFKNNNYQKLGFVRRLIAFKKLK